MTAVIRSNFWQKYPLQELNLAEWEALCDGCGVCCLVKFLEDDEDAEEVIYTDVACKLLDCETGACSRYPNRHDFVPDCIRLTYDELAEMMWLPNTCAYKRLYLGLDLPSWHVLITKNKLKTKQLMREQGITTAGRCISELGLTDDEIEQRIINWVEV